MRYLGFSLLVAFAFILSCNTSKTSNKLNNTDNLPLQEYTIDINKDTTLVTKNGALLKIPKGSLTTDQGNTVTLEIKEAYSIQQMIKAGLVTQSNGAPLSSGGMIYIDVKGGQNTKITQPIKVAIPTDYLSDSMQLFKGEKDENGNTNWKDPATLPENKQLNSIQQGKVLFQNKCAGCHAIGKDGRAPDLAHFPKRIPYGEGTSAYWYHHFSYLYTPYSVDSNGKKDSFISERWTDLYACNLINRYGGNVVGIQTEDWPALSAVYNYIQNESDRNQLPLPSHSYLYNCTDSCVTYRQVRDALQDKKEMALEKKQELSNNTIAMVEQKNESSNQRDTEAVSSPRPVQTDYDEKVFRNSYDAAYYQFTIESFGWFNIDCLLKNFNDLKESELWVRVSGQYHEKINIYLIIPSQKIFVGGGPTERNDDEFAFDSKNGKIRLPQNMKAFILALTETEGSIAFALKEFTTSPRQELDIALNESGKETFDKAINSLSLENLTVKVADTKMADELRNINSDLKNIDQALKNSEKLKPKQCDCDCSSERAITDTTKKSQIY
jgi:hypothetical protein